MRAPAITAIDRAGLIAWPVIWALAYYGLTLQAVWGREVHPIQAMFLIFGLMATGLLAAVAAGIWLSLLRQRQRKAATPPVPFREVLWLGGLAGAAPMTALLTVVTLLFAGDLGALAVLGLVAASGVAGALSALTTSSVVALRHRADARRRVPTATGTG